MLQNILQENSPFYFRLLPFLVSKTQKQKGEFMEELKNTDRKSISTKRKIEKITYEVVVYFNENTTETMQDKLTRIMLMEFKRKLDEKKDDFD